MRTNMISRVVTGTQHVHTIVSPSHFCCQYMPTMRLRPTAGWTAYECQQQSKFKQTNHSIWSILVVREPSLKSHPVKTLAALQTQTKSVALDTPLRTRTPSPSKACTMLILARPRVLHAQGADPSTTALRKLVLLLVQRPTKTTFTTSTTTAKTTNNAQATTDAKGNRLQSLFHS